MIKQALTLGLVAIALALPHDADAQGRGRPKRPQSTVQTTTPPPASAATPTDGAAQGSLPAFRQFGSWLDDATAAARGTGWTGIGIGYWRIPGGSQIDAPILDVAYGLADRVQLSATVPFYRASYLGATARGLDDVYLSGKVVAVDPTAGGSVGLAISPLVEILSNGSLDGGRVHWALPVSVELRADTIRLYGSGGYFSRGAIFAGGAIEWTSSAGTLLTGALTQSLSINEVAGDLAGGSRQRVDATIAIAHLLTEATAAYMTVGRSLTSVADGGTSLALSGGLSFRFARHARQENVKANRSRR